MKRVMRTIVKVVNQNKRNWVDTLRPKGVELGKPHLLHEYSGRDLVRENEGIGGRGIGKKRMTSCNKYEMLERYEGKLSRTVLRGGEESNRLVLSRRFITAESAEYTEF